MKNKPRRAARSVIGENPLDAYLPDVGSRMKATTKASKRRLARAATAPLPSRPPEPKPSKAVRATYHLPHELVEEVKDAAVFFSGPPLRLTLAGLVRDALRAELNRLKKEHNRGRPFPKRERDLVGGRPIGS